MNFLKSFKREHLIILTLVILFIPTIIPLTKSGYFPTQDYIYVARVYEMKEALGDGHFPVRWVKDFRNGEPLYNFYAPLPYYAGAFIKFMTEFIGLSFSYLLIVKILFGFGFLISTLAMYFLGKKLFRVLGGFISALLFLYAPYHSTDVYVRGALSESWALIFFPLIFLSALNLSEKKSLKNSIFLSLSLAGLFFTHNVMTMLFAPFILAWMTYLAIEKRDKKLAAKYFLSIIWGISIAATFLIPAFVEKSFVQTNELTTGYFDYRGHFVAVRQWFSPFWGYGASLWGAEDDMSFQIGLVHWAVLSVSGLLLLIIGYLAKNSKSLIRFFEEISFKKWKEYFLLFSVLFSLFIISLLMMHNKSAFIWERFDVLKFTQFPWRFLGISIFFVSLLGGFFFSFLKENLSKGMMVFLTLIIVLANVSYFQPESYYLDSIDDHYISQETLSDNGKLPKDYLPIWVKKIRDQKVTEPHFIEGEGIVGNLVYKTGSVSFSADALMNGTLETPITYFPGWEAKINGQKVEIMGPDDFGLVRVKVPPGNNKLEFYFKDTPVRIVSNLISLVSILFLVFLTIRKTKLFRS